MRSTQLFEENQTLEPLGTVHILWKLWVPAVSERCFTNVSSEGSFTLESQAKGESGEGALSEQIPMLDLLSEGSLFDQRSVKVL